MKRMRYVEGLYRPSVKRCSALPFPGHVITWLRLWGSYVERRLSEIECRIIGEPPHPPLQSIDHMPDHNEFPLFDAMKRIEVRVQTIQRNLGIARWRDEGDMCAQWGEGADAALERLEQPFEELSADLNQIRLRLSRIEEMLLSRQG